MKSDTPAKKILILAANPKQTSRLRLDEEVRDIKEGLRLSQQRDKFILQQEWAVRPRDVRRAVLDFRPNIIHFSGHGSGTTGLSFEDETGKEKLVTSVALAGLFGQFAKQVECVVLNACYSEEQAVAIAQHIDYVIGMNAAIGDKAALEFAVGFYDALVAYDPRYDTYSRIEFAFNIACNAIQFAGVPGDSIPIMKKKPHLGKVEEQPANPQEESRLSNDTVPANQNHVSEHRQNLSLTDDDIAAIEARISANKSTFSNQEPPQITPIHVQTNKVGMDNKTISMLESNQTKKYTAREFLTDNLISQQRDGVRSSASQSRSLFEKITQHKNKFLAVTIIVFGLVGYPTYQYLGQQSQSLETEKDERLAYDPQGTLLCKCTAVKTAKQVNGEDVTVRNFIVEAKFNNPDDAEINDWAYGFSFRDTITRDLNSPDRQVYTLVIKSNKTWEIQGKNFLQKGYLQNLNVSNRGSNKLVLKINGEKGNLYVNNQSINEELKVENVITGKVYLVSQVFSGKSVKYENFTVWSIRN